MKHNGEKPAKCKKCDKAFISAVQLKIHMRNHDDEKLFGCLHCESRFNQQAQLKAHEKHHWSQDEIMDFLEEMKQEVKHENPYLLYNNINPISTTFLKEEIKQEPENKIC